jgi:hypothetical protein
MLIAMHQIDHSLHNAECRRCEQQEKLLGMRNRPAKSDVPIVGKNRQRDRHNGDNARNEANAPNACDDSVLIRHLCLPAI